jgi:hypothetical protein
VLGVSTSVVITVSLPTAVCAACSLSADGQSAVVSVQLDADGRLGPESHPVVATLLASRTESSSSCLVSLDLRRSSVGESRRDDQAMADLLGAANGMVVHSVWWSTSCSLPPSETSANISTYRLVLSATSLPRDKRAIPRKRKTCIPGFTSQYPIIIQTDLFYALFPGSITLPYTAPVVVDIDVDGVTLTTGVLATITRASSHDSFTLTFTCNMGKMAWRGLFAVPARSAASPTLIYVRGYRMTHHGNLRVFLSRHSTASWLPPILIAVGAKKRKHDEIVLLQQQTSNGPPRITRSKLGPTAAQDSVQDHEHEQQAEEAMDQSLGELQQQLSLRSQQADAARAAVVEVSSSGGDMQLHEQHPLLQPPNNNDNHDNNTATNTAVAAAAATATSTNPSRFFAQHANPSDPMEQALTKACGKPLANELLGLKNTVADLNMAIKKTWKSRDERDDLPAVKSFLASVCDTSQALLKIEKLVLSSSSSSMMLAKCHAGVQLALESLGDATKGGCLDGAIEELQQNEVMVLQARDACMKLLHACM